MNKYQTLDQENLGKKIMREQFDRALFQATFENLLSQVFQKQINANKIQMDLIRKIQGKSESVGSHLQIIKQCRKSIDYVDMILKDVRQYFFDLKIDELYNLFDSLFRILVYILKKVSQCYLRRVQMQRKNQIDFLQKDYQKSINQAQNRQKQNSQKKRINNRKKDMRQLQILDFQIAGIELKEQQINNKMNLLISDLQQERRKIQNIDPVSHNQIYNEIEKIFIEISQKTECLFNNFFKGAFQQQNNFVRPQQIQDQVLCPLKNDLKVLAKSKINKVIQIMSITFQNKLDKSIQQMKTIYFKRKPNKKRTQNISIKNNQLKYYVSSPNSQKSFKKCLNQTDSSVQKQNFKKHHAKFMQMHGKQNEQLKKTIRCLNSQIQELKKIIKKQQSDRIKLSQESLQLQKLFKRRTFELQQAKSSLKQAIQRNIVESSMCTYKKQVFSQHPNKKLHILNEKNTKFDMHHKQTQTDENNQSLGKQPVVVQYKSFISVRSKIRKGSIDAQEKNKNKRRVPQAQKNLKSVISKLSGLLIEKQIKQNTKQTLQIQKLVQQDKYEEVIEIIKKNLNVASSQSKKNSGSDTVIQEKQKNTRQKKKRDQKIVKNQNLKINSSQMVNFGVQTMQRSMKSNIKVFKNTLRDNQPNKFFNKTHSMDSHELQNKIPQQKPKKDEHYLSSTQTPLNWLRSARQTKQNEDSNFLIKNIRQPFYRNSMVDQKFNETKMKTNGKKNIFLQNTFFEQINLDVAESNKARSKRDSLMLKMYGMKQKQNMQKDYRNRNSKNSGIIIQQYQDGTNSNKISNNQEDLKCFTEGRDSKQSNIKREDFILDKCGVKQGSQENNQDFSSQKLIEMLKSASNQISPDKINQIIDKFRQSYITKCSNFSDQKNKIND